ncbi:MAG: FG-GAP-like repeat-containing protein [Candidatus Moraniibacteriota bacterium]
MLSKIVKNKKIILSAVLLLTIIIGGVFYFLKKPKLTELQKQGAVGDYILNKDFSQKPITPIKQNENNYQLTDSLINGPTIQYANPPEELKDQPKNELNIEFPKNYQEPINIKLDEQRIIQIKDNKGENYNSKLITEEIPLLINNEELIINNENPEDPNDPLEQLEQLEQDSDRTLEQLEWGRDKTLESQTQSVSYLKYQSKDKRTSLYYAYQKENSERKLKHWAIYNQPQKDQIEKESYTIFNAKIKLNDKGEVEVYYFGEQQVQNEQVKAEVDSDLMARAQRTLQKELGQDILNTDNHTPDFIIPTPYYINKNQEKIDLTWKINQDTNTIETEFNPDKDEYPIALDPTIQFTAPGQENSSDVISGENVSSNNFGSAMTSGDFNADGKFDLVVAANNYLSGDGRVYLFYGGGIYSSNALGADVIISPSGIDKDFGTQVMGEDLNNDNRTDLIISDESSSGKIYIFYNDGEYPSFSDSADLIIQGGNSSIALGDINLDGKNDLIIGVKEYLNYTGRVYILYNDGSIPTSVTSADIIINGISNDQSFGGGVQAGDIDGDGDDDIVVGATSYGSGDGRVFVFYNDSTWPTSATNADLVIAAHTDDGYFGGNMLFEDLNGDGKKDLIVASRNWSGPTPTLIGRVYVFFSDGSIPTVSTEADIILTGEGGTNYFGHSIARGDLNNDGKNDLIIGARGAISNAGRVYVFYNDGDIPSSVVNADVIISGEYYGYGLGLGSSLSVGDFNSDGKSDLAVGSYSGEGKAYIFYSLIGQVSTSYELRDQKEYLNDYFSSVMTTGDLNNDGKEDLIVGSYYNSTNAGKVYIFYNDGSIPGAAAMADKIITGEVTEGYFGFSITSGDIDGDGWDDLAVGAYQYSSLSGRAYVFYGDNLISGNASDADVIIDAEGTTNYFGYSMTMGDFDYDGDKDLAVGATRAASGAGKAYIFYNDGSISTMAGNADIVITGESSGRLGATMVAGDFNNDERIDLAIGASEYSSSYGRLYILYNDGSIPTTAATADVIIAGQSGTNFGNPLIRGDFNNDGIEDLATGGLGTTYGRVYVFYCDGSVPTTAATADLIINSDSSNYNFGASMTSGDFDYDGDVDLVVGGFRYSSYTGRAYFFYNDGAYPITSATADFIISGESTSSYFGNSMTSGDFNNDSRIDLAVGTYRHGTNVGRIYIFYNDGSISNIASGSDLRIIGNNYGGYFGSTMTSGDFNNDGETDLIVGAYGEYGGSGKIYLFYNDGSLPASNDDADLVISGEGVENWFGNFLHSGDFNNDGNPDILVGAKGYNNSAGRIYVFYNDGSYPSLASEADFKIDGEGEGNNFGCAINTGDIMGDNRVDLIVGASGYSSNKGRVYVFNNDGEISAQAGSADLIIDGESSNNYFGSAIINGDFDYDMDNDFVIGAYGYSSYSGRAYIFNNDGSYPSLAANADIKITGEYNSYYFGNSFAKGDFNDDNREDLIVGSYKYSTNNYGRIYLFYNDGSIPTSASSADIKITGDGAENYLASFITTGDYDNDDKDDLMVGAYGNAGNRGKVYIFRNDGTFPTSLSEADIANGGLSVGDNFGVFGLIGDFDSNNRVDFCVGYEGADSRGGFVFFINDAPGTKPDYVKSRGGAKVRGTVRVR